MKEIDVEITELVDCKAERVEPGWEILC